jgi:hypothetical protein
MTPQHPIATVMLLPDETPAGTVYLPANRLAESLTKLMGKAVVQEHQLPLIEALGFQILFPNGQPLPFPKAYQRSKFAEPLHVKDEA